MYNSKRKRKDIQVIKSAQAEKRKKGQKKKKGKQKKKRISGSTHIYSVTKRNKWVWLCEMKKKRGAKHRGRGF